MKKIEELYQEILQDEGLKGEFVQAAKDHQLEAFFQKNDCNVTLTELQEFAEKKQRELVPLSDTELDTAAGGFHPMEALASMFSAGIACGVALIISAKGGGIGPADTPDPDEWFSTLLCH